MNNVFSFNLKIFVCSQIIFFTLISNVLAWKPKTHIYLAEQVLNELIRYDSVVIYSSNDSIIGKFAVQRDLIASIKQYQNQFRAGAIGPDGYPDIITGQTLIHPRLPGTFRWLNYLDSLTKNTKGANRAFVAGFFTHAAGDLFGHTFINHFAGGPFVLGVNAIKHTLVEGYLDNHLPQTIKYDGSVLLEKDVSIGSGVDQFIYENMIAAWPGSALESCLLNGSSQGKYSLPRIFSRLRNGLQNDIAEYYAKVAEYDRAYNEKIEAAKHCSWSDLSCSKTVLYTQAGLIIAEKQLYQLTNGPIITYKEHWRDDIDDGLKALPAFSHEVALALFVADSSGASRAKAACGSYVVNHLLSMAGAPDLLGHTINFINDILNAIVPQFIIDAIDAMKDDLVTFLLKITFNMTPEEVKEYFSDPGKYFGAFGLDLESYRVNELHFTAADSTVDYMKVPALFNTLNMIRITLLDSSETMRLLKVIGADTSVKIPFGSLMRGEWFWSLDESRQWAASQEKSLVMPLWNDTCAFFKIFKHQTGENDIFPSPFADSSMSDTSASGAITLLPNDFQVGSLNTFVYKYTSYHSIYLPYDGQLDVYVTPIQASLHPVEIALEFSDGWYISTDSERKRIAHTCAKNLRKGNYLVEVDGDVGNWCDVWDPTDTSCNLWGGYGKYAIWCYFKKADVEDVEPDDDFDRAIEIPLDSTVARTLGYCGLKNKEIVWDIIDYMKFKLPQDGNCQIIFSAKSTLNAEVNVYDSLGDLKAKGNDQFQSMLLSNLKKGTYYIDISKEDSSYGAYSVTVKTLSLFSFDSDTNNTSGSGDTIEGNKVIYGNLDSNDTVDWYQVKKDSGGQIEVILKLNDTLNATVTIVDESGNTVSSSDSCIKNVCHSLFTASKAGVFQIKVERKNGGGTYELVAEGVHTNLGVYKRKDASIQHKMIVLKWNGKILNISINACKSGIGEMQLFDSRGRASAKLWKGQIALGLNQISVNTATLKSGFYVAKLILPDKTEYVKLIVNKFR
jgi:hypothetical protein